jgi:ATP-dependent Lon protease
MGKLNSKIVPVIPLPKGQVLLPGVSLRISIAYRPDIAALLAHIYSTLTNPKNKAPITIGCVPLGSHLLSPDGKRLLPESEGEQHLEKDIHPASARQSDLYGYGTLAKVSGVQGRVQGELSLVVEGLNRFRIEKFIQERPYFQAQIEMLSEEGMLSNTCIFGNHTNFE